MSITIRSKEIALFALAFFSLSAFSQSKNQNYLMETTMLDANEKSSIKSVQYYNGLGYPTVSVANVGGSGQTAYAQTTYDALGREECKYLPVSKDNSILYKDNVRAMHSDKTAFYKNHYDALDRVISVELPGEEWRNNDKRNWSKYLANTDADKVLHYVANPNGKYSLVKPDDKTNPYQYYPANSLTKEVSIDADEKRTETFKDLLGNVILQRTVLDANKKTYLDTYYVYNAIGQLCYVLPPLYQKNGKKAITAYEYRYDSRGRITKKFLPGAEYIQYWYDNADRMIAMQDGVMRKNNKYRFTFYDNLGRLVVQGLCSSFCQSEKLKDSCVVARFDKRKEGFLNTSYVIPEYFRNSLTNPTLEIVNYYDKNQDSIKGNIKKKFSGIKLSATVSQIGQLTGCIAMAGSNDYVSKVMVYDIKGNLTKSKMREIGGRIVTHNSSYTFTNNPKYSKYTIDVKYGDKMIVYDSLFYNSYNNKMKRHALAVSHGDNKTASSISYTYDNLGRISTLSRPSSTVSYTYDVHGWLKNITTNSFKEELFYASCPDTKYDCYNGNIGTMKWSNNNYGQNRGYQFVYDGANRLTDAVYGERTKLDNKENRYNEVLQYDENGNITRLQRRGLKMDNEYGKIDNLSLSYNGNQLFSVEEDAIKDLKYTSLEFKKENGSGYKYNENGSLIADKNRGIAYITYDYNNNPDSIFFTSGSVTKYVYSASGQKLRVVHHTAPLNLGKEWGVKPKFNKALMLSSDTTDYLLDGSIVLKNGKIDKILFDGGYAQDTSANSTTDKFAFYYYNQDHLGNNREVVDAKGVVQQVTNYYPFGAPYVDATAVKCDSLQPYKYNGKELDLMHGLNTYDYGARQHDPILCRWDRIDPLCEKYYSTSPYAYCNNTPINALDPAGKDVYLFQTALPGATGVPFATHSFIVVKNSQGKTTYAAYGPKNNIPIGGDVLAKCSYLNDEKAYNTYLSSGKYTNVVKNVTKINVPEGLTSDEFDQKIVDVINSFGNNPNVKYSLNPTKDTEGNCNSSSSTILNKAGVPAEEINQIRKQSEEKGNIFWGFSSTPKPWTKEEQKQAVQRKDKADKDSERIRRYETLQNAL